MRWGAACEIFSAVPNKRNLILLWLRGALLIAANTLASAAVLSGYLLYIGLTDGKIGMYLAVTPAVNLIVSLLFSPMTAKCRAATPAYSVFALLTGILTASYFPLFQKPSTDAGFFPALMLLGCLLSASGTVQNIFNYKQPCEVMEMTQYSLYISVDGIISGLTGIFTGVFLSFAFRQFPFAAVSAAAYLTAGILTVLAAGVNGLVLMKKKPVITQKTAGGGMECLKKLLRNRDLRILAVPNILRGFGVGVTSMILVLAVRTLQLPESDSAILAACTNLANLIGCAVYAVPDLIYRNVSSDIMSPFHTWRLALTTLGTTLSTSVIGAVMDFVPPTLILTVGALAYFVCAASYGIFYGKKSYTKNIR